MFYAAGTYGFYGYVFADLGQSYDYLYTQVAIFRKKSVTDLADHPRHQTRQSRNRSSLTLQ